MPDRNQEYHDEIYRRAVEIINRGDIDALREAMTADEDLMFRTSIAVMCACRTELSVKHAVTDMSDTLLDAAKRIAKVRYDFEMAERAKQSVVQRFYDMCGLES